LKLVEGEKKDFYAACVGKGIYLGVERRDIRWSIEELARRMTDSRECDFSNLKQLARYLKGTPNVGRTVRLNAASRVPGAALTLEGYGDTNSGGPPGMDRRFTDCAIENVDSTINPANC
jgi:hypothetical protein